jgi:hypothetical protein
MTLGKTWYRPSLMVLTETEPVDGGSEGTYTIGNPYADYIVLSDDNRSDLTVAIDRIEYKKRMINGRMRSYHVTDKKTFSVSWNEFPSASAIVSEAKTPVAGIAGGKDMLKWHQDHPDSFWMMLVYDTPNPERASDALRYRVEWYNVFFESFDYNVVTRGSLFDHWNVSMSLVEV